MQRRILISLSLIALVLQFPVVAAEGPTKIRVIGTGKAQGIPILTRWLTAEPSTDPLIIPTREWGGISGDDIKRLMRLYFPRTKKDLLTYEFFFLAQVDMSFISPQQQRWIRDSLDGMARGAVNTRSTMGARDSEWRDSLLSEAFPNDVAAVMADSSYKHAKPGPLVIKDDESLPDILKPYKRQIEKIIGVYTAGSPILNTMPKEGSVILSYTKNNLGFGHPVPGQIPHIFYWSWNRSIIFTFQDMVYNVFWGGDDGSKSNPFALDIVANMIWFSTGRPLPEDAFAVHDLRIDLFQFGIRKSLLVGLLEFAEKFGANPSNEYARIIESEKVSAAASDAYLDGEFDAAHEAINTALDGLAMLEEEALTLKDKTLFWVYFVEWSITTATLLGAGFILWALMVRRSLYREVGLTREPPMVL